MKSMEISSALYCRRVIAVFVSSIFILLYYVEAAKQPTGAIASVAPQNFSSSSSPQAQREGPLQNLVLVEPPPLILTYHNGSLLTVGPVIPVYLIWYGSFSKAQRATVKEFFASFKLKQPVSSPSVASWWKMTSGYKDTKGSSVAPSIGVAGEVMISATKGKALALLDIQTLVVRSLRKFPTKSNAIYVVLTAPNIDVESFCMDSCASHFVSDKAKTKGKQLPYIWVGNPATQCPGLCAWPFAKPDYGPPDFTPLLPPNKDVGIDGMIISLGSMLAGIATNPFDTGYYQGDASAPLEASTACAGIYGAGAYPGYPGQLLTDTKTNASYNANGGGNRKFMLPAMWNPVTSLCATP